MLQKLSFYEKHRNEPSIFFTTPIPTTYKTPILVHRHPVSNLGILITTARKQSLYCQNRLLIAQWNISSIERIRVIHLITELQLVNDPYLLNLFDLTLLFPEN
jgi:hypothetical protein